VWKAGDSVPFCVNCGTKVDEKAAYCSHCGTPQSGRGTAGKPGGGGAPFGANQGAGTSRPFQAAAPAPDFLDGISDRTAAILCYIPVFGVIPAIIFLASKRFRSNMRVRFNGFQSLYLFVAWLIVSSAAPVLFMDVFGQHALVGLLKFLVFGCWIYLLVKSANQEQVRLPFIGDLAARSATEQL
jgi:uncharacterized membrane protein